MRAIVTSQTGWHDCGSALRPLLGASYEADFLGAVTTANEVESNSFNPCQRQLWGQVEFKNGLSVLAGQSWSLLTTDRKGLGPLQEMIPLTIDSQYAVGYNWARQWGARVTKNLNDHVWAAFAIENPETTAGVINAPPVVFELSNCEGWWEGQHDEVPEQAFHMNGQN